ncbi:MAG TPA: hypothetical protein VEI58_01755 [Chthoniobacterales bacterium]|nr:hypothetical protein [Chthoniobacterales bacterium]
MKMWNPLKQIAAQLSKDDMKLLGINRTMRLAKQMNRVSYGRDQRLREQHYRDDFDRLLAEHANSSLAGTVGKMRDGWLLDTSQSLPYLDELIREAELVIAERGGRRPPPRAKPFIVDIARQTDLDQFPSFLNFALSPPVLRTVSEYLGFIPMLSTTMPPGLRLTESSMKYDEHVQEGYRESQLYHLDHHDSPLVYVIVLLRDVTSDSGPFTFLPASVSERAGKTLDYRGRGTPYRISDQQMYSVVKKKEAVEFMHPKGSVLFLDSSRCFHYGSRDCAVPRYQMMYAFVSSCRTDFSELLMTPRVYTRRPTDSRLRRMLLAQTNRA